MFRTSTWWSFAILRTTGDRRSSRASVADHGLARGVSAGGLSERARPLSSTTAALATGAAPAAAAGSAGAGFSTTGVGAAATGDGVAAAPASEMMATTLFTGTVAPSFTLISVSTPAAGAGISASTLSVEISNSGSSRSIASPTFFNHRTMVPSATDSPIWGITTGVGILVSASPQRNCSGYRLVRLKPDTTATSGYTGVGPATAGHYTGVTTTAATDVDVVSGFSRTYLRVTSVSRRRAWRGLPHPRPRRTWDAHGSCG
jgi:hypothetical protein